MNWSEVVNHIGDAWLAHIATADGSGAPHVAVVAPAIEGEVVWILTGRSARKTKNLGVNPRMALMWAPRAEIYVHGTVEVVDDVNEKRRIWSSGLLSFDPAGFFGTPENPELVLLKVTPQAASVMAQGPDGLARHRWHR